MRDEILILIEAERIICATIWMWHMFDSSNNNNINRKTINNSRRQNWEWIVSKWGRSVYICLSIPYNTDTKCINYSCSFLSHNMNNDNNCYIRCVCLSICYSCVYEYEYVHLLSIVVHCYPLLNVQSKSGTI